jgi:uncharacterized protein RhaS with RHS repeats
MIRKTKSYVRVRSPLSMTMAVAYGCVLLFTSAAAYCETSASYTYDALGRIVSIVYTDGVKTTTVTYSYDASGNRASMVVK